MNSKRLLILLIISLSATANAQNATIDSLKTLLERPDADSIKLLIELTKQNNLAGTYEAALVFSSLAVPLALKRGDSLEITMAYRFKGATLRRLERSDEALELIMKAFAIAKRNDFVTEIKFLLNSMAIIYSNKARYDLALDYHFQSLVIREAQGDQSEISITLNNIAFVHFNLKNYKKALEFFNKSLVAKKRAADNYDLDRLLLNMAMCEIYLGNFEKAVNHIKEAFTVCGSQCSDDIKTEGEFGLGEVYYNLQKLDEAQKHFTISYQLAQKSNNLHFQSENLICLGKIAMKSDHLSKAEGLFIGAEAIADHAGYNQLLINTYEELFKLYALQENNKKEIFYLKKYVYLSDSLISLDLVRNISAIQSRYDEREHIKSIKTLEENIVLKNEAISSQRLLNVVLGSAAVLLIVIGILIYRLYVLRNRSNKQLDNKVRERTRQLEEGQAQLQGLLHEQTSFMENIREEIKSLSATWKGLIVLKEVALEREIQVMTVEGATSRLDAIISRIDKKRALMQRGDVS